MPRHDRPGRRGPLGHRENSSSRFQKARYCCSAERSPSVSAPASCQADRSACWRSLRLETCMPTAAACGREADDESRCCYDGHDDGHGGPGGHTNHLLSSSAAHAVPGTGRDKRLGHAAMASRPAHALPHTPPDLRDRLPL